MKLYHFFIAKLICSFHPREGPRGPPARVIKQVLDIGLIKFLRGSNSNNNYSNNNNNNNTCNNDYNNNTDSSSS